MAKYTFLVPIYKGKYLKEALDSILAQTFTDFKVIVSDDCSPEDLESIVRGYEDERITYRRNKENIGAVNLTDHWNMLVGKTDSEYLIMASDDDIYDKDFLKEIDKLATRHPEVDVLRGRVAFIDAEGDVYMRDPTLEEYVDQLGWFAQNYTPGLLKCMANYVFRTSALKDAGGFEKFPLAWYSDIATVLKMGFNGGCNTRDVVFHFRMSGLNISSEEQTTREAARLKMDASYMYDNWMKQQIAELKYEHNKLNDNVYARLLPAHKLEIVVKFVNYSKAIGLRELVGFVRYCRRNGYFDSTQRIIWLLREWWKSR